MATTGGAKKPYDRGAYIRLSIPADDEVALAFLDMQGARNKSQTIRSMIHLFVAEHGYTNVMSVMGKKLVESSRGVTTPPGAIPATTAAPETAAEPVAQAAPAEPAPEPQPVAPVVSQPEPVVAEAPPAPVTRPAPPTRSAEPEVTPEVAQPATTPPAAPIDDMEDIFSQARNQ